MPNVTLYQLPNVVQLTENVAVSVGTVINRTDFNLHKGVTNEVEFLLKTIDRKPVNLTNRNFMIYIVDHSTNRLVLQAELLVVIAERGHCRLILSDQDLAGFNPGYYRFAVTEVRVDSQILVYTDQNHSLRGFLEVFQGPIPRGVEPLTIGGSEFIAETWGNPLQTYRVTHPYPGAAQRDNRSGNHTLALYTTEFSGDLQVQASLSDSVPTSDDDWFNVVETHISTDDTVTGIEFQGNYQWVRFFYQPMNPGVGTVDKAVFRN